MSQVQQLTRSFLKFVVVTQSFLYFAAPSKTHDLDKCALYACKLDHPDESQHGNKSIDY